LTPLRIVHAISSPAAGGAEVFVKDLVLRLAQQGHRPSLAFVSRSVDIGRTDAFEKAYLADLDRNAIPYTFIGHESRRNPLLGAARLRRFCREQQADVYHSHLKYALVFGAGVRIPHVHTHHNIRRHAPAWMWPLFNRMVDAYVGISDLCGERLRVFSGRPVATIRNAVDSQRLGGPAAAARQPGGIIRCIAVGTPGEQKNYHLLLAALRRLPAATRARVVVDVIGEGPESRLLEAEIAGAGLTATVRLLGSRNDVTDLMRSADLFLMSSAWEGLPIALLEATATGLPFIATDVGACAEIAALCGNGLIVPSGDAPAFARALASLADHPERITTLSGSALEHAGELLIEPCADAHLALYRQLVAGSDAETQR
jgi:glycosyltransferase involved in cell wall biosynthesis